MDDITRSVEDGISGLENNRKHVFLLYKEKACNRIGYQKRVKRKKLTKVWLKKKYLYTHLNLLNEISNTKEEEYENYYRMKDACFVELLERPYLIRQDTCMIKSITS